MPAACAHCGLPVPAARRGAGQEACFCCFGCRFAYGLAQPAAADGASAATTLFLRLGLGVMLSMTIMMFSWFFYSRQIFGRDAGAGAEHDELAGLFAYLLMFLCAAVVAMLGVPLAADALSRRGRIDANLLIVIGVTAAFVLSVIHTFQGEFRGLYYDTTAMILVLVTLGSYLDAGAKRRASLAAADLLADAPSRAWVYLDDEFVEVDAAAITPGTVVRVRPGEIVSVDGVVQEGASHVSEACLTGESRPRPVRQGEAVLAGSVNVDGQLFITATHAGNDRLIARLHRLLEEARGQQPPIQRIADRVSAVFVPGVVVLALAVFGWHCFQGDAARGIFDGLSVLLISCPCALGLAAPLASWSALHRAARRGILIDSAATLERAAGVGRVYFDKTGTLTDPTLRVEQIHPIGVTELEALRLAAAVESASLHPIALAIVAEAQRRRLPIDAAQDALAIPGVGTQAVVGGRLLRLGGARLLERHHLSGVADDAGMIQIYLTDESAILARFDLSEQLRPDAADTVKQLQTMGVEVSVLTGDQPGPAQRIAQQLRVPVIASLLPADKLAHLAAARRERAAPIAMVGDGINDAPVLAAADVGFAVGGGSDLAKQAGNIRLLTDHLDRVPQTLALARHAMRHIRLNLLWAFSYNVVGLTLAAAGVLTPVFAAVAMFGSSLMIVHTSRGAGRIEEAPNPKSQITNKLQALNGETA